MSRVLEAFHNKQDIKDMYLTRVLAHYSLDEIIKGQYWQDGKGCAVGCTIHSGRHGNYETELGIPEWVARLEDTIFEGLPNEIARDFPRRFLSAVPVGFNKWTKLYHDYMVFVLEDILKDESDSKVIKAVEDIVTLHKKAAKGEIKSNLEIAQEGLESAAWSAAEFAARAAAESAAWSAAESAAESAAWSAAESAAYTKLSDKFIELLKNSRGTIEQNTIL